MVANVGPEIGKTAKTAKTTKCAKKCAKLKMFKTALSGISQQRSVSVCCASQFRPVQAQRPCPAAQRSRESAYHSGSFPEKLQGTGALTVPGMCPGGAHGHIHLQPIGTVPRLKNYLFTVFENTWKTSKLNILFLLFDI